MSAPAFPAAHRPLAQEVIYRTLVLPALGGQFNRIWAQVDGPAPHPADGPLIIYLTHSSWWDAYMLYLISYRLLGERLQNYIMMEEKQLRAYPFFTWCGAFSINRHDPVSAAGSVSYIADRLREQRARALWIFPQGRIVPPDRRPIVAYPGIVRVAQQAGGATLWPVALRYEFRGEQQPEAFVRAGPYHTISAAADELQATAEITARLTANADALRDDVLQQRFAQYRILLHGRQGINRLFDVMAAAARGRRARARQ